MPLSKIKKLKLLAKLNPEKEAVYLTQILKEEVKNLPKPKDYSPEIRELQNQIANLQPEDNSEELQILENKLNVFAAKVESEVLSFNSQLSQTKTEADKELESLASKLEDLRVKLLQKGGGSMNQKISINSSVMSTRYADFNLIGGISKADNNTTKQVDITFAGGGASAFTSLTDVPSSYTGQALKAVTVNAGETGLVFTTGGDALTSNPLSQFASTTSLQLKGVISDETGSGALVFATSPTLVTPALGTPSSIVLTNATGLPIAGITGLGTGVDTFLATPSSANLRGAVTDETGSGVLVFATSPTLVTPVLGDASATTLTVVSGTLVTTQKSFSLTATLANSSVTETGINYVITGAGSGSNSLNALSLSLIAGYTGSGATTALNFANATVGTGSDFFTGSANMGVSGITNGSTATGRNVGGWFNARNGANNIGVFGRAIVATNSAFNAGVYGSAINSATANVGGFFTLSQSNITPSVSAALMADNGTVAAPIFVARDNSTEVFRIDDGGNVGIGTSTIPSPLTVNGLINMKNYTVATLPAGTRGDVAYVTDALAPAFLAIIVGGGAVVTPVFFNGANWVGF